MAKYIRTKNEIGTFGGFRHNDFTGEVYTKVFNSRGTYREYTNIVAEADTIEELCDEIVCVEKNGKDHNFIDIEQAKNSLGEYIVYGAIWTDKGLIYIAKMNEDGVLCLI